MFFFISLYLQQVLQLDPLRAGLAYLPLALTIIAVSTVGSSLVSRLGFKPVLLAGLALVTIGALWFSRLSATGSFVTDVLGPSLLVGAGLGASFVSFTIAGLTGTRPAQAGLASGLINTSQQVGGALGLAVLASIATTVTASSDPAGGAATALTAGFSAAFLTAAGISAAAVVLAAVLISGTDSRAAASSNQTPTSSD